MQIEPISCWRPTPARAASFAAPPYDVFDRSSARSYVKRHPSSFLEIDRPETAFEPEHDMYDPDVYTKARELLNDRVADGTLLHDEQPCYYIWRLATADHEQVGLVCGAAVDDYKNGTIRRHEQTRAAKQADRIEHIRTTHAQTGPIFLTYRDEPAIDTLVSLAMTATPLYDFTDEQDCHHSIWRVARKGAVDSLRLMFERVPAAYIADGHHRAASAVAVCEEKRQQAASEGGKTETDEQSYAPYDLFLAVIFLQASSRSCPTTACCKMLAQRTQAMCCSSYATRDFPVSAQRAWWSPQSTATSGSSLVIAGMSSGAARSTPPTRSQPLTPPSFKGTSSSPSSP